MQPGVTKVGILFVDRYLGSAKGKFEPAILENEYLLGDLQVVNIRRCTVEPRDLAPLAEDRNCATQMPSVISTMGAGPYLALEGLGRFKSLGPRLNGDGLVVRVDVLGLNLVEG